MRSSARLIGVILAASGIIGCGELLVIELHQAATPQGPSASSPSRVGFSAAERWRMTEPGDRATPTPAPESQPAPLAEEPFGGGANEPDDPGALDPAAGGTDPSTGTTEPTDPTDPADPEAPTDPTDPAVSPSAACGQFTVTPVLATAEIGEAVPPRQWGFSLQDETLFVNLVLTGVTGTAHVLTLDFTVPDGFLYRRATVKFRAGEVYGPILGYPWEYVDAVPLAEGWGVTYALPIRGSDIERFAIVGGWRLTVSVDDDPSPVASIWFSVTP